MEDFFFLIFTMYAVCQFYKSQFVNYWCDVWKVVCMSVWHGCPLTQKLIMDPVSWDSASPSLHHTNKICFLSFCNLGKTRKSSARLPFSTSWHSPLNLPFRYVSEEQVFCDFHKFQTKRRKKMQLYIHLMLNILPNICWAQFWWNHMNCRDGRGEIMKCYFVKCYSVKCYLVKCYLVKCYLVKWYLVMSNVRSLCEREINFGKLLKILITPREPHLGKWFKNCLMIFDFDDSKITVNTETAMLSKNCKHEEKRKWEITVTLFQTYQSPNTVIYK